MPKLSTIALQSLQRGSRKIGLVRIRVRGETKDVRTFSKIRDILRKTRTVCPIDNASSHILIPENLLDSERPIMRKLRRVWAVVWPVLLTASNIDIGASKIICRRRKIGKWCDDGHVCGLTRVSILLATGRIMKFGVSEFRSFSLSCELPCSTCFGSIHIAWIYCDGTSLASLGSKQRN